MEGIGRIIAIPAVLTIGAVLAALVSALREGREGTRALTAMISIVALAAASWALLLWPEPSAAVAVGKLVADPLGMYVAVTALAAAILGVLVSFNQTEERVCGEFFAMVLFAAAGLAMVGLAGDLVMLFLGLELISIPGFVLVGLSRRHRLAEEAAAKYFFIGVLTTALTAYGFVLLFGAAGTMSLAVGPDVGALAKAADGGGMAFWLAVVGLVIAFAGLSYKTTALPFYFYAPDVYQGASSSATAIIAFVPKIAGFVALLRICAWIGFDGRVWDVFWPVLWVTAAATMTAGNVLALLQKDVKRILAYSSVAHSGYILVGLVAAGAVEGRLAGLASVLFYVFIYGVMTLGAFAVIGYVAYVRRGLAPSEEGSSLADLAGLSRRHPLAALVLAVCVFSLLGMPPTAGFWSKVYVFTAALSGRDFWLIALVVIGAVNAAIGAAYYLRIVFAAYMAEPAEASESPAFGRPRSLAAWPAASVGLGVSAAIVLGVGLFPAKLMRICEFAAQFLLPG